MRLILRFLLITLIFVSTNSNAQSKKNDFVGNWIASDHLSNQNPIIFSEDNYISMSINGEFIDGKNFIIKGGKNNGKKGEFKYSINTDKNPMEIDLIAIMDNDERGRILGTIKPIDENNFLMILSFDGVRDTNFDDTNKENIIKVKRVINDN